MTPEEVAKREAAEEWQRRLNKFSESIINLLYWDKEPLEQAIAYREKLQVENSRLRDRVVELESQLTQRVLDGALSSCWTIESVKDKDVARKVKIYIRENWQELAELLDKHCLLEAERDVAPRQ